MIMLPPPPSISRGVAHIATALLSLAAVAAVAADASSGARLSFDVSEGQNLNSFLRAGPVAAHLLLRSGSDPRIIVAFPAGNSGVGLWFAHSARPVTWALQGRPQPRDAQDAKGRVLHGIVAEVTASGADLRVDKAVLSSVRVLRDYQTLGSAPAEVLVAPVTRGQTVSWERARLDGAAGYLLSIEVTHGELLDGQIKAAGDGRIALRITALTGERPLTPITAEELLEPRAAADSGARNALAFLSYREKFLAGSWRFDTYFGRDTLMSVRLLMPALTPVAVEAGLGAVLTRLSSSGEVAHEEDIGESAILYHRKAGEPATDRPAFNYTMIDGNYMLGPVAAAWLLDDPRGRQRAPRFLATLDQRSGEKPRTLGADLVTNLELVLQAAKPFADEPGAAHLLALKPGRDAGQWRDSGEGLGRGRIPYDVNAVFMPAALEAAGALYQSHLLDTYLTRTQRAEFARAAAMAGIWNAKAGLLFDVQIPNAIAVQKIAAYGAQLGVPVQAATASIGSDAVRFHALSLGADFAAVPIVHSDEGFALLFGHPDAAALDRAVGAIMRPFPAGLMTDVGLLVANPVFATPDVQARFSKNAYHGTVVWSWQQALLAAGLARQLDRPDLPPAVRLRLRAAQTVLWRAIDAGKAVRNSELWSWAYADGHFQVAPFGASQADVDESNAAQLWSTVYLAIPEPAPGPPP
jgi:hypothetical protein